MFPLVTTTPKTFDWCVRVKKRLPCFSGKQSLKYHINKQEKFSLTNSLAALALWSRLFVCCRWLMDNCGAAHLTTSVVLFMATLLGDFLLSGYQLELTSTLTYRVRGLLLTSGFKKVNQPLLSEWYVFPLEYEQIKQRDAPCVWAQIWETNLSSENLPYTCQDFFYLI